MSKTPVITIGNRVVGGDAPVFLVAELSANHGNKLETALETVKAAASAGADAIKLQTYTPDTLTLDSQADDFVVKTDNSWQGKTLHSLYGEAMTPWEWHQEIKDAAEALGLFCFSTPFDHTAVQFLEKLNVPVHKIASFELVDLPLIECIARTQKPLIISTGMASLGEIEAAVNTCRQVGNDKIVLLRCVSSYPADPASMHLRSLETLKSFGTVVGLSDHTIDPAAAITAVALGAKLIEKHFILDRSIGGPDAFFSLTPEEFRSMRDHVRTAEASLGVQRFGTKQGEQKSVAFRRSLYVSKSLQKGEIITCDHVRSVRPSFGLDPKHLPQVLGKPCSKDLVFGSPMTWDSVGSSKTNPLTYRPATKNDSSELLRWRNDAQTRAMSLTQEIVDEQTHATWFQSSLNSPNRYIFIACEGETPIGSVRLDDREAGCWEISFMVAPEFRGKHLSSLMIQGIEPLARTLRIVTISARIRSENEISIKVMKKAGYYHFTYMDNDLMYCQKRIVTYP
jgi:pseudaminic acid synthase